MFPQSSRRPHRRGGVPGRPDVQSSPAGARLRGCRRGTRSRTLQTTSRQSRSCVENGQIRGVKARDRAERREFRHPRPAGHQCGGALGGRPAREAGRTASQPRHLFTGCVLSDLAPPGNADGPCAAGPTRDADALLARNARHMFLVPWRDSTLVGVWHSCRATRSRQRRSVAARSSAHTSKRSIFRIRISACTEDEVRIAGFGLVPFGTKPRSKVRPQLSFGKQSRLIDHRHTHHVGGLVSGHQRAIHGGANGCRRRRSIWRPSNSDKRGDGADSRTRPLPGGAIDDFAAFERRLRAEWPHVAALLRPWTHSRATTARRP